MRIDEQLRKCMILLSEKWQEKNIEFVPELEEATLVTDKNLMMQVWINLIDNAMKYSEANAKIHIILTKRDDEIYIVICDEGIGIPKDKANKIYNRFYQCDESHKKQGAGLGLAIVKRILDLLHGTIHYESRAGKRNESHSCVEGVSANRSNQQHMRCPPNSSPAKNERKSVLGWLPSPVFKVNSAGVRYEVAPCGHKLVVVP